VGFPQRQPFIVLLQCSPKFFTMFQIELGWFLSLPGGFASLVLTSSVLCIGGRQHCIRRSAELMHLDGSWVFSIHMQL